MFTIVTAIGSQLPWPSIP